MYQPEQYTNSVEYYIDGVWLDTKTEIPFRTNLSAGMLADGVHTLTVIARGEESDYTREYTITKSGGAVTIAEGAGAVKIDE